MSLRAYNKKVTRTDEKYGCHADQRSVTTWMGVHVQMTLVCLVESVINRMCWQLLIILLHSTMCHTLSSSSHAEASYTMVCMEHGRFLVLQHFHRRAHLRPQRSRVTFLPLLGILPSPRALRLPQDRHCFPAPTDLQRHRLPIV